MDAWSKSHSSLKHKGLYQGLEVDTCFGPLTKSLIHVWWLMADGFWSAFLFARRTNLYSMLRTFLQALDFDRGYRVVFVRLFSFARWIYLEVVDFSLRGEFSLIYCYGLDFLVRPLSLCDRTFLGKLAWMAWKCCYRLYHCMQLFYEINSTEFIFLSRFRHWSSGWSSLRFQSLYDLCTAQSTSVSTSRHISESIS